MNLFQTQASDEAPTNQNNTTAVSFGMVSMFEFDASSSNNGRTTTTKRPKLGFKRCSVEDFELLHRRIKMQSPSKSSCHRRRSATSSEKQSPTDLERLRRQIEATIEATDDILAGACHDNDMDDDDEQDVTSLPLAVRKKNKDGRWVASSFPGPETRKLGRPTTRSATRISQLHMSQLNLTTAKQSHQPQAEGMQNAVFPCASDAAPKRPTRKRSSDSLRATDDHKNKHHDTTTNHTITLHKAHWKSFVRPTKKQSLERLATASWRCDPTVSTGMQNATWDVSPCRNGQR